jgi:hypothetical protein
VRVGIAIQAAVARRSLVMEGRYRDECFNVVEADLLPGAVKEVREKLEHLCSNCLPNNTDALNKLFSERQPIRCYTFLPEDMSAGLRQSILAQEHCSWAVEYFAGKVLFQRPNMAHIPMTWRYVSRDCLKSKMLGYLDRDPRNICALGEYDGVAIERTIERDFVDRTSILKVGGLLCFGKAMLGNPIPMVLDSVYFDSFGFMTRLPLMANGGANHQIDNLTDIHADEMILATSHVFIDIHEEESICMFDFGE